MRYSVPVQKKAGGQRCKAPFSVHSAINRRKSATASGIAATARDRIEFACAWTANIIARNVAKHAKFTRWERMSTEHLRVEFRLGPHPVLVGVLRGAVHFQASQAGFDSEICAAIAGASEDVCRETLAQLTEADSSLEVVLETFTDRMEVSILNRGEFALAAGIDTFTTSETRTGGAGPIKGWELLSRVDRVLYNMEDGKSRTTLVKFLKS
jgi:hypothetical protein